MTKYNFRKASEPRRIKWTVTAQVPVDGGKAEDQTIEATFILVDPTKMAQAVSAPNIIGQNGDVLQLKECLASVDGVDDLADVYADPIAVSVLARGYWEMLKARLPKN